ncbi:hypothetical protein FGADI_2681 [Fusarium gaditjirri]|uniref:Heterokaryon incompatibility domain-containing protein n=1 Tax=Fusarium gaditjirri TaxID=282569 RepID=A0A8H4X231_9HYPO|nr:hypothetical protein FGADI_2681 [Fusarium gaditjirri]
MAVVADAIGPGNAPQPTIKPCPMCASVDKLLAHDDFESYLGQGNLTRLLDHPCTDHALLLQWIETTYGERIRRLSQAGILRRSEDEFVYEMSFRCEVGRIPCIYPASQKGNRALRYQVLVLSKDALATNEGNAPVSVLDPEWIDLDVAKSWMKKCTTKHTKICQNPREKNVSPAWLIDTRSDCLVPGQDSHPFVALSYRWGMSTNAQLDIETFKKMMNPGSLSQKNEFLTPTVRDAIHTVRAIGERYLWVDAICLEPGNETVLAEQLQLMGSIYASAKLTIVALDGDASAGLKGLRSQSSPRTLSRIFPWRNGKTLLVRDLPTLSVQDGDGSEYFERGWTYQEYFLSRRRLIFGNQQIHWQCSCATWHEDLPYRHDDNDEKVSRMLALPNIKKGWPDFNELAVLLNEYNGRELTYPEDAFPAVNGLLTYLQRYSFEQGFLFGLPRGFFDAALMWSCQFRMSNLSIPTRPGLRRRRPSGKRHSILPDTNLPSWSWIGWQGKGVSMLKGEAQFIHSNALLHSQEQFIDLMRYSVITVPITQWYSHKFADGAGKRPVSNCPTIYKEESEIVYDKKVWKIKEGIENPYIPMEVGGNYVYEHVKFPGRSFLWPLSTVSTGEDQTMDQNPFISCRTKRTWLGALKNHGPRFTVQTDMHLDLFDVQRRLCGWLQLPDNEESRKFPNADVIWRIGGHWGTKNAFTNPFPERDKLLELVAICIRKYPEADYKTKTIQWKDFYGVLWVEWVNGVAYRKGCGYVKKELWEEQDVEDVDLVLG